MSERKVVYTAVVVPDKGHAVAIVEKDVPGYALDPQEPMFPLWDTALRRANEKNAALKIDPQEAWEVVASSISASNKQRKNWSPRGSKET